MKSRYFLFIAFFCLISIAFSQNNTNYFDYNEIPLSVIEDSDQNYVIVGFTYDSLFDRSNGTIIRLNSDGDIINQLTLGNEEENLKLGKILYINNIYTLFGGILNTNTSHRNLLFLQFDEQWNEINRRLIPIPYDRTLGSYFPVLDSDSMFVISGFTLALSNGYTDHFYIKLDSEGDTIVTIFKNSEFQPMSLTILESQDHSKYYDIISGYEFNAPSGILQLDKNFNSIVFNKIEIPSYLYTYGSLVMSDSTLLVVGDQLVLNWLLTLVLVNENAQVIESRTFRRDSLMKELPAFSQPLSRFGNNIFLGATSNYDHWGAQYSNYDSWFHLIKMDENLIIHWEKWYGGDAYYFLNSVLGTSDGGCLMVGTKHPHGSPSLIRGSHFIKVDANGNVQWTQNVEIPEWSYKVYPNPTQSVFNIENNEMDIQSVELFDISGKLLNSVQDCNNTTISIDLSSFPQGVYLAKVKSSKGIRTEKVVRN